MLPRRFQFVLKLFQLSLKYVYILLMNYIIFNSNIVIIYVKYIYILKVIHVSIHNFKFTTYKTYNYTL